MQFLVNFYGWHLKITQFRNSVNKNDKNTMI